MKSWKILIAAVGIACAVNVSFADGVTLGAPKGWVAHGINVKRYEFGIDPEQGTAELPAFYIASADKVEGGDVASISENVNATPFINKTMKLTVKVKCLYANTDGEIWLRGTNEKNYSSSTANGLPGEGEWREVSVIMPVSGSVAHLEIGLGLRGKGKVWFRDLSIEEWKPSKVEFKGPIHARMKAVMPQEKIQNLKFNEK